MVATKRFKSGAWRYTVKRARMLPRPVYLTFDSEAEGDAYVARLEELLDQGILPDGLQQAGSAVTLGAVIDQFTAQVSIKPDDSALLVRIDADLHDVLLEQVEYRWAEAWVATMKRERHLSPGTIRHYVGALARCLDWAVVRELLSINPLRQLPRGYAQYSVADQQYQSARHDREVDRRLEPGEESLILAAIDDVAEPDPMRLMFVLALESAMRMSEVYSLQWDQVDLAHKTVFLDQTKNGHKRQVPLTTPAVAALRLVVDQSGPVFPWGGKSRHTSAKLSARWRRLFERAGAAGFTFHCLRHEATSRLFERTKLAEVAIMKITGHSSVRVLARYANLRASDLADALW